MGLAVGNIWFPSNQSPVTQQWNATLQRELRGGWLVELGYLANKGNHLCDGETLAYNQLPASYLLLCEKLNSQVANPFYGVITNPNSTLSRPTVVYRQLLSPFPRYITVNPAPPPFGNSLYHSFQARVERRFAKGVGVRVAYTGGKLIDDSGFASTLNAGGASTRQDVYIRRLDRAVSTQDVSSRLVISANAQLPFGRRRD